HKDVPQRLVTNKVTGQQVLLTEPSKWGQRLSVVDFTVRQEAGHWKIKTKSATTLNSNTVPEDPAIKALLKRQHDKTVQYVNQTVAQSAQALSAATSHLTDSAILDYIQAVQTKVVSDALKGTADETTPVLSIAAPFSRTAVIPAGPVSIRDIAGL